MHIFEKNEVNYIMKINNQKIIFLLILVSILLYSCAKLEDNKNRNTSVTSPDSIKNSVTKDIYRYFIGSKDKFKIWIVDGTKIRQLVFNEFIYGGNSERYPFILEDEIWIDNYISSEEYETTIAHEIHECNLMAKY